MPFIRPDAASVTSMPVVHMRLAAGSAHDDGRIAIGVDGVLQLGIGRAVDVHHRQAVPLPAPKAEVSVWKLWRDLQGRTLAELPGMLDEGVLAVPRDWEWHHARCRIGR